MVHSGLEKIRPDKRDYSLLHTFASVTPDPKGLPENFSIYDGREIPDQDFEDFRFPAPLPPLMRGCTGEAGAFEAGIQDGQLYNPQDLYLNTSPFDPASGRDIRDMLKTLINRGPKKADGSFGPKRKAYFNCYGAGKITDFDAARIALWINQYEKRGVIVGTWWYPEFQRPNADGSLPLPSFRMDEATLHCHLITGWRTNNGVVELEDISWQGMNYANAGRNFINAATYDALLAQPYTGAFTITKNSGFSPIPIGYIAIIDHLVYFIRSLFA